MRYESLQVQGMQLRQARLAVRLHAAQEDDTRAQVVAKRMAQKASELHKQHVTLRCVLEISRPNMQSFVRA